MAEMLIPERDLICMVTGGMSMKKRTAKKQIIIISESMVLRVWGK